MKTKAKVWNIIGLTICWSGIFFLEACDSQLDKMPNAKADMVDIQLKILTIDGCEYLWHQEGGAQTYSCTMTHKGNCKNPIHHYNQPLAGQKELEDFAELNDIKLTHD